MTRLYSLLIKTFISRFSAWFKAAYTWFKAAYAKTEDKIRSPESLSILKDASCSNPLQNPGKLIGLTVYPEDLYRGGPLSPLQGAHSTEPQWKCPRSWSMPDGKAYLLYACVCVVVTFFTCFSQAVDQENPQYLSLPTAS